MSMSPMPRKKRDREGSGIASRAKNTRGTHAQREIVPWGKYKRDTQADK